MMHREKEKILIDLIDGWRELVARLSGSFKINPLFFLIKFSFSKFPLPQLLFSTFCQIKGTAHNFIQVRKWLIGWFDQNLMRKENTKGTMYRSPDRKIVAPQAPLKVYLRKSR